MESPEKAQQPQPAIDSSPALAVTVPPLGVALSNVGGSAQAATLRPQSGAIAVPFRHRSASPPVVQHRLARAPQAVPSDRPRSSSPQHDGRDEAETLSQRMLRTPAISPLPPTAVPTLERAHVVVRAGTVPVASLHGSLRHAVQDLDASSRLGGSVRAPGAEGRLQRQASAPMACRVASPVRTVCGAPLSVSVPSAPVASPARSTAPIQSPATGGGQSSRIIVEATGGTESNRTAHGQQRIWQSAADGTPGVPVAYRLHTSR